MKGDNPAPPPRSQLGIVFALCGGTALLASIHLPEEPREENLDNIVPFETIKKDGDTRINRIIDIMERSETGREIVRFASTHPITFQWSDEKDSASGTYLNGRVELSVHLSDKDAALILGHEIRHGWQAYTMPLNSQVRDPVAIWEYSTLEEIDSCAYTAHFAAEYKDETGELLTDNKNSGFGDQTAHNYSQIPATQRDFYRQAVLPCFAEISNYPYSWKHMKRAKSGLEDAQQAVRAAKRDPIGSPVMVNLIPLDNNEKKELFSRFFNQSMTHDEPLPEMAVLSPNGFVSWIKSMTQGDPEIAQELERLRNDFSKISPRPAKNKANPAP